MVSKLQLGALICVIKIGDNNVVGTMIKLDSTNYSLWKSDMGDFLFCKDLHGPIKEQSIKALDKSKGGLEKRINKKIIGMIRQWKD